MQAFWAGGYAGTSYADLERVTKLRRQSLIYAFGDKQQLFEKALRLYADQRVNEIGSILSRDRPVLENIRAVLDIWLRDARARSGQGCLIVNTTGELGRTDPVVARIIDGATNRLVKAFEAALKRAQADGGLRTEIDPRGLARLIVSVGDGALLHARSGAKLADVKRAFDTLLALIDQ